MPHALAGGGGCGRVGRALRNAGARAQIYHDNLEGHRHEGHGTPVITSEARKVASKLLDDPIYLTRLRSRLRKGTAGAIEIWLWRWKLGDPPRAEQATEETDRKRFDVLRSEVRTLIMQRPQEHRELEDLVLGEMPAGLLQAGPTALKIPCLDCGTDVEIGEPCPRCSPGDDDE